MLRVDLHTHTTASDGRLTPTQLVDLAVKRGLDAIAITDHDTTGGIEEAQQYAQRHNLAVFPGIELSAYDNKREVHVLGYFFDFGTEAFQDELASFKDDRYPRGKAIVEKLGELGVPVEWEKVLAIAGDAPVGRPHIARGLLEAGHVDKMQDAFDMYLADDAPAFVPRKSLTPETAVEFINDSGGVAVLAHPGLVDEPLAMLRRLVPVGLGGVEVHHPENAPQLSDQLKAFAAEHDLIMTGGSDFHNQERSNKHIGQYLAPVGAVDQLRAKAAATQG